MPHGSGIAFKQTLSRKKARDVKQRRLTEMNLGTSYEQHKTVYNFPELTPEELEKVKSNIRGKMIRQNRKRRLILIFLTCISIILLLYFLFF